MITLLGFFLLTVYALGQILDFYGFNVSNYGSYFVFYLVLMLSIYLFPDKQSL